MSILDHRPDLGTDYVALADELLERLQLTEARRRLKKLLAPTPNGAAPDKGSNGRGSSRGQAAKSTAGAAAVA
jgi:hypothetical protein